MSGNGDGWEGLISEGGYPSTDTGPRRWRNYSLEILQYGKNSIQNLAEKQKNHVFLTNPQNIEKHTEAGRGKGDPKHSKTCVLGSDQKTLKNICVFGSDQKHVFLGLTKNTEKHVYHL